MCGVIVEDAGMSWSTNIGRDALIRLQRIYNFCLFHAIILSFLDVLQSFLATLYHFLGLTY